MQYVNRKSLVVSLVLSLAACGGSEIQAEPAPELTIESIEAGDVCETGGIIVYVDGVESATVCNGTDGQPGEQGDQGEQGEQGDQGEQGEPGEAPNVVVEAIEAGDVCEAGGQEVRVEDAEGTVLNTAVICNGVDGEAVTPSVVIGEAQSCDFGGVSVTIGDADPFEVCDGAPGEAGEPGEAPSVSVGSPADCEFGGVSVTIGDASPFDVCNGAPGADGEPGASPAIDVATIEAGGACGDAGGYLITITDAQGVEETATVCNGEDGQGGQSGPLLTIESCTITAPSAVAMSAGTSADAFGQVVVEEFGQGVVDVPASFVAELGYGDVSADPATWLYRTGISDVSGELLGDFGTDVAVGEYGFVWRVALEEGDAWTYCGVNGTFDTFAPADAGTLTVAAAGEPVTIAAWDFAGSSLTASEGVGSAQFIEGGVPTTCNFFGGGDEWTCDNFLMDTEFFQPDGVTPKSNVYFRYEADFTGYSDISASGLFKVSNSGPTFLQIAAEYADGTLEFMAEPFEITARNTEFNATFVLPPAAGNSGPVAYRFYPYNPSSTGGNMRMLNITFTGTAL